MLFNSLEFLYFFVIVYLLYRLVSFRTQNSLLLGSGYLFYGAWDLRFLFILTFSTAVDFCAGVLIRDGRIERRERITVSAYLVFSALLCLCIDWRSATDLFRSHGAGLSLDGLLRKDSAFYLSITAITCAVVAIANAAYPFVTRLRPEVLKKATITASVVTNLGLLAFFKYFNFFVASANDAALALGLSPSSLRLDVVLPVGISFYTFQSLSYTIDVYRNEVTPARRLKDFALFVAYFPPLVAGPIERGKHLLPQLLSPRTITTEKTCEGARLVIQGLFKKVAVADGVAPVVNQIFDTTGSVTGSDVLMATLYFTIQIYCDFSGYSDIARGVSKMLGIDLMLNFNLPWFSTSPSDFWRRWHISLSSWLRDYLYIPLGGNRGSNASTYRNLMTTMTLGGLWHGAAWNYMLWGIYQGALLCLHRLFTRKKKSPPSRSPFLSIPSILLFAPFMCYGWLIFRASSFEQITDFSLTLAGFSSATQSIAGRPTLPAMIGIPLLLALEIWAFFRGQGNPDEYGFWLRPFRTAVYALMIYLTVMGLSNPPVQFIYFQF